MNKINLRFIYFFLGLFLICCNKEENNKVVPEEHNQIFSVTEIEVINWFENQQLPNGLLESVEDGNIVSLYDNALAALVFMLKEDYTRAEKIFDYFNARIINELKSGVGGFSQFRDRNGNPNNHRWMGDNAWLLIALNWYKEKTSNNTYDQLILEITNWLTILQDLDGGLYAGYNANSELLNYKVTEGNIDAFNAINGYTSFHNQVLNFLKNNRWNNNDKNLVAWPSNPTYLYALDLHSWSYLIFQNYPISSLTSAERFLTSQFTNSGVQVNGYCFDEDKDVVWIEGTGQMALAFGIAEMEFEREFYLNEIEKTLIQSSKYTNSSGFPYATNLGTTYGADPLWNGAESKIAISSGAWYLFAKQNFNPFAIERNKNIPELDIFWLD